MKRDPELVLRAVAAAALAAVTVCFLLLATGEGRGSPKVTGPVCRRPPGLPTGANRRPLPQTATPAPSTGPSLRVGPLVPEEAWIEAEVRHAEKAPWELSLAPAPGKGSERGEGLVARLEPGGSFRLVEAGRGASRELASLESPGSSPGSPPGSPPGGGTRALWARRRGELWSVWLDGRHLFRGNASVPRGARVVFRNEGAGPVLGRLSVRERRDPAFSDDFMREGPDENWRALTGAWELAGTHFAERSANPFALFARFPGGELADPFVEYRWQKPKAGVGVHLSSWRGMVQIERITGNGSAAEAGIREHDIVLSIDGTDYRSVSPFSVFGDLEGPAGSVVNLTVLRPGELRPRNYSLKRRRYRWAQAARGQPISGSPDPEKVVRSSLPEESLAVAGRPSWDGYRYEASVACAGAGGAGLVFALRDSSDYHCFAMVGDTGDLGDGRAGGLKANRLALFKIRGGEREVLVEREWGPLPGTYYRLAVDLEGERIRAFVDGAQVFDLSDPDLPAGRVGCWALKGAGAYFDDVAVSTDRAKTAPPEHARASAVYRDEIDMRVWANPADEWEPDPETEWWWNKYRFPGTVRMTVSPRAQYEWLAAELGATEGDPFSGVGFVVDVWKGIIRIHPNRIQSWAPQARAPLDGEVTFELSTDGTAVVLRQGERLLFPVASVQRGGDAVAMWGLRNLDDPGVIQVTATGVKDYYFRRAPVDWVVAAGKWGVLNKWICDPRFSWFGGHSRSLAMVWNKNRCGGDVTLDFYSACVMIIDDPPYERVGDFSCTILGDGESLASGYTLVVSGGRNCWARLYGGGRLLAESRDPSDRLPGNVLSDQPRRFLHQRWFRITLERVTEEGERRVRYLFDGREVFNVPDVLGLESGYCGLFTQDNGMLVSRARIAADTWDAPPAPGTEARRLAGQWGTDLAHRQIEGLTNLFMGEIGTRLETDGTGPSGAPAVKVTNTQPGGAFAAAGTRELDRGDSLAFDFRAGPGAKVDLYLMPPQFSPGELGPYRVRLTGPEGPHGDSNGRHPVLAGPLAEADGRWHHVEVRPGLLFESYRERRVLPQGPRTSRLLPVFCNLEEGRGQDYLPCGIGGNGPGTSYWVSGLRIEDGNEADRAPPRVKRIFLPGEPRAASPGGRVRPDRVIVEFEDDHSGVDKRSLLVALTPLADGSGAAGAEHRVPASPLEGWAPAGRILAHTSQALQYDSAAQVAEIDLASVEGLPAPGVSIVVEVRRYHDRAGRRGEPAARAWCPGEAPDEAGPEIVSLEFLPAIAGEVDLDFEEGPRALRDLRERLGGEAPALSLDRDTPSGEGTALRLTASTFESDCMFRIHDGPADLAQLLHLSFDYRLPERTPVNLIVRGRRGYHGVVFSDTGDPTSEWSHHVKYAGEFEDVRLDGEWHHAELDLARVFQRAYPRLVNYIIGGMYLCDWGWNGLWPGDGYWLDNLRVSGVRRGREVSVRWRAFDVSGVERAAWVLDSSPDTEPDVSGESVHPARATMAVPVLEAARLPDGRAYFHLRLADGRGNWSRTFHASLLVDNTPPRVARVFPEDGASSPALEIALRLEDYSGVDPLSLRLDVADGQYRLDGRSCVFDRAEGLVRWSARGAGLEDAFAPGERIDARLLSARDVAGNELAAPFEWSWRYEPSLDTTPPPAPAMRLTTGRGATSFIDGPTFGDTNDFERELGPVERGRGCEVALSREAAREGSQGCRITVTSERRGYFTLRLRERYWHADERPYLMLDYRLPPGIERLAARIDLLRETRDREILRLLPADGEWHRAVLDLGSAVEAWNEERRVFPSFKGEPISLAGPVYLVGRAPPGARVDIDNVEFVRRDWRRAVVEIPLPPGPACARGSDADESGVVGLAVLWDNEPDTVPKEVVTHRVSPWLAGETFKLRSLPRRHLGRGWDNVSVRTSRRGRDNVSVRTSRRGRDNVSVRTSRPVAAQDPKGGRGPREERDAWYLHVRLVDGAGNWGETGHLEVDLGGR